MDKLMQKLVENGKQDALKSKTTALAAAVELGYTKEEASEILNSAVVMPLTDEELENVNGGGSIHVGFAHQSTGETNYYYKCVKEKHTFTINVMYNNHTASCPTCGSALILHSRFEN